MITDKMTFERFDELAIAYGGTLARWPDSVRREAEAFLVLHPEAEQVLAEARLLDQALDGLDAPADPSDALMARILGDAADVAAENAAVARASAPRPAPGREKRRFSAIFGGLTRWAPGMAFAASLALGVGLGANEQIDVAPAEAVLALVAPEGEDMLDFALAFDDGGAEFDPFLGGEMFL